MTSSDGSSTRSAQSTEMLLLKAFTLGALSRRRAYEQNQR